MGKVSGILTWTNKNGDEFDYSVEGCQSGYAQYARKGYMVIAKTANVWEWRHNGALIQIALPELSDTDREFLMHGLTPEEQDKLYGKR